MSRHAWESEVGMQHRGVARVAEAASLELGDHVVAEWLPHIGITYDSHNEVPARELKHGATARRFGSRGRSRAHD